ncbi:MAG TPA: TlpA disulfide reductase family protein [Solirubrobacteraceae bacterium]|jgi:thiol-disulfide isomerase/thioredoxin
MQRRRRWLGWTVAVGAGLLALAVFGLSSNGKGPTGRAAPQLPREHLVGPASTTISSLLSSAAGRPALVVFWASWCGPCATEAPALERFSKGVGRGRMVGVDWSDALSGARSFVRQYGWTFPNLRDSEGTVGNDYRLTGLPTTFVLDGRGRIHAVLRGPQSVGSLQAALAAAARS